MNLPMWKDIHQVFDPIEPASSELRVARTQDNPLSEHICPRLRLPLAHQKFVLAGGIGSGKSTELRATASQLTGDGLVVLVDLWRHFESTVVDPSALDHLQPAELIGLLGLAVLRTGTELLGHTWDTLQDDLATALQNLVKIPDPEGPVLDVVSLAKGMAVVAGGAAGALLGGPAASVPGAAIAKSMVDGGLAVLDAVTDAAEWKWKLGLRGRARSSDQDAPVRAVLKATNALLDDLQATYHRQVVILVDGLDRVQDARTFEDLFVESGLLADLRCALVATLQLGLVQRYRSRLHWCKAYDFTYVPVAERLDPERPDPKGMDFFRELTAKRFRRLNLPSPFTDAMIERLAYRSGGRLRDFMVLVREVVVQAMLAGTDQVTERFVSAAIDQLRRERESGLNAEHIRVLQSVLDDPERQLPAGEVALELLERQLLLAYPNESTWYLPHTLLMLNLVTPAGSTA